MNERAPSNDTARYDLAVIGAGIAGLVAANAALDRGLRPVVVEPHPPGGRARTTDRRGWCLNVGGHGLYLGGSLHRVLVGWGYDAPGGTPSDITLGGLRGGVVHPLPVGPSTIARTGLLSVRSKVRFAALFARLGRLDTAALSGHSLADWLAGEPDDVRATIESIVRTATYANAPDLLDAAAAVGQLRLATEGVRYVDGGWGSIIDVLTRRLITRGGELRTAAVASVGEERTSVEVLLEGDGGRLVAEATIIAAGGPELEARLLGGKAVDIGPKVEACAVDLLVRRPVERRGIFGIDEPRYLSPHSSVAALAPAGNGLLSGLHYLRPGTAPATPEEERLAARRLAALVGVGDHEILEDRLLHRSTVAHGLPLAANGGLDGRPSVEVGSRVFRAGDWVGPHGMLADAAAASGAAAASAVAARCARISR